MTPKLHQFSHEINQKVLDEIKDILEEDYSSVINDFIEDCNMYIANIEEGIRTANIELIVKNAHPLKSSSGGVGATGLYDVARTIELQTKSTNSTIIAETCIPIAKELMEIYSQKLRSA